MTAGTGAFGFSGVPAGLLAHRRLTAAAAAFPFTGVPAGLYRNRTLTASPGAFGYAGIAAGLLAHRKVVAGAGAFGFAGITAGLYAHRRVSVEAGAFPFLGVDVTFDHVVPLDFTTVNRWAAVVQEVNAHVYVSEVTAATAVQQRNEVYVLEERSITVVRNVLH